MSAPRSSDGGASVSREFERECVQFFAEVVQIFGVPKSVGQIYGVLYASPAPLSFSDIVDRLEISKGSASQGLQLLRSLGAINVVEARRQEQSAKRNGERSEPDLSMVFRSSRFAPDAGRREYFEPELSLRRLVGGIVREQVAPFATAGTKRLLRLRELAERDAGPNKFYLNRSKQLNLWRRRLKAILPMLSVLLGRRKS